MRTRRISIKTRDRLPLPPMASAALLVLLATPSLTSALTIRNPLIALSQTYSSSSEDLFSRDSSCGESSYVQCGSSFPSDFCCPSTSTCIPLAGNTTAICCPKSSNCTEIETIPCEISLEDKSQHPSAVVMTTALTGTLETCGEKCCPFGFSCTSDGVCEMDQDQSAKPSTSSVASSATATASSGSQSSSGSSATLSAGVNPTTGTGSSPSATGTSGSDGSSTAASAADSTSTSSGDSSPESSSGSGDSSSRAGVVAGGVIGGIAGAVCLGLLILFLVKREMRRKRQNEKDAADGGSSSRSSSFGNILAHPVTRGASKRGPISKPILNDEGTVRSDFGRKISPHMGSPDGDGGGGGAAAAAGAAAGAGGAGLGVHDYYGRGGGGQSSEKSTGGGDDDDDGWTDEPGDEDDGAVLGEMRSVPRSPPNITERDRAVSSLYGDLYMDTTRATTALQGPARMPSARQYGGFEPSTNPVSEYGGGGGSSSVGGPRDTRDPNAAYINVFADENALSPHSLAPPPPGRFAAGQPGDRETRFSDFGRQF